MLTTHQITSLLKPYQYTTSVQREKGKSRMRKNQMERVVLELIRLQGQITSETLAKKINVTVECANKNLRKLRDEGLIVSELVTVPCRSSAGVATTTRKNIYRVNQ